MQFNKRQYSLSSEPSGQSWYPFLVRNSGIHTPEVSQVNAVGVSVHAANIYIKVQLNLP